MAANTCCVTHLDRQGRRRVIRRTGERLFCTVNNQRNVTVLGRDGRMADRLMLDGAQPTNCAFLLDGTTLLFTELSKGQVEALPAPRAGLPLHAPTLAPR